MTQALQLAVNGVLLGFLYGLLGVGFGLIIGVTGRFHFAFGVTFGLTAYAAYELISRGIAIYPAILLALVLGTVTGVLFELWIYRPLMRKDPKARFGVIVSALGLSTVWVNLASVIWGQDNAKSVSPGFDTVPVHLGDTLTASSVDLLAAVCSIVAIVAVWAYLRFTKGGRAVRAVRANPAVASLVGISVSRVSVIVFAMGSMIAGLGGVLTAMRLSAIPTMGDEPTLIAIVVAFLAGLGSVGKRNGIWRFVAAGMIISLLSSLSQLWIDPVWQAAVTFGALFVYVGAAPVARNLRQTLETRRHITASS